MDVLTEARTGRRPRWKRRLLIALPLLLVAVIGAGALALYAYDRSQSDRIAAGIRVADVEIGGLGVKQARAKLVRVLLPRYRRPLVIATGQRRFVLSSDAAGLRVFGSGWVFVTVSRDGKLAIETRPNQDSPLMDGKRALLGNDLWEHAYYLQYQNRRGDYLKAWWNVVNWPKVAGRYAAAKAGSLGI